MRGDRAERSADEMGVADAVRKTTLGLSSSSSPSLCSGLTLSA